jgi:hypothetical protein
MRREPRRARDADEDSTDERGKALAGQLGVSSSVWLWKVAVS